MEGQPFEWSLRLAKRAVDGARAHVGPWAATVDVRIEEPIRELVAMQEGMEAVAVERDQSGVRLFAIGAREEPGGGIAEELAEIREGALRAPRELCEKLSE